MKRDESKDPGTGRRITKDTEHQQIPGVKNLPDNTAERGLNLRIHWGLRRLVCRK